MSLRSPGRGLRNVGFPSAGCHPLFAATTLSTRIRTYSERIHFSPEYATESLRKTRTLDQAPRSGR
eukprot:scaffold33564_cov69-Phaeocystis_antarctica.AAC.3